MQVGNAMAVVNTEVTTNSINSTGLPATMLYFDQRSYREVLIQQASELSTPYLQSFVSSHSFKLFFSTILSGHSLYSLTRSLVLNNSPWYLENTVSGSPRQGQWPLQARYLATSMPQEIHRVSQPIAPLVLFTPTSTDLFIW